MASPARNISLAQLTYFVAVAEDLHFGRAAQRLQMAQPALSQAVKTLEISLGVSLFRRTSRHVELTDAGLQLLPAARETLAAADRTVMVAERLANEQAELVRVGFVGDGTCDAVLAIGSITRESTRLRVETRYADFSDPSGGLRQGHVDVAFLRTPIDATGLAIAELYEEARVAVLPTEHPLADRDRLTIAELLDDRWLQMPSTDVVWRSFWLADEHWDDERPRLLGPVVNRVEEQLAGTTAGGCVSLTPASIAALHPRQGIRYVPVDDVAPTAMVIAWREGDRRPTVHAFIEAVKTHMAPVDAQAPAA